MKELFVFILFSISYFGSNAQATARVVRVKDADTFVLNANGRAVTIRLLKVDAPETAQNYGIEATRNVSALLLGKFVSYDSTGHDRYGRVLASIRVNGARLDSTEIANGWAWHYKQYDSEQLLANLMAQAATDKIGLWQCGKEKVCPPWLFRGYNYKNRLRYCKGCKIVN